MNANVAGREKHVIKVIHVLFSFKSVTAMCWVLLYFKLVTDTVMSNSKVIVLNLHYTLLIFCPYRNHITASQHFKNVFNGFHLGVDKEI